jgi:hypothetical protein
MKRLYLHGGVVAPFRPTGFSRGQEPQSRGGQPWIQIGLDLHKRGT